MFKPEKMRKVHIFALNKDKYDVLAYLQKMGLAQVETLKNKEFPEEITSAQPGEDLKSVSEQLLRTSRLINILKIPEVKLPFIQNMFGLDLLNKEKIKDLDVKSTVKLSQEKLKNCEDAILKLEEQYTAENENKEECSKLQEIIETFEDMNMHPNLLQNTERFSIISGRVLTQNMDKISEELEKETEGKVIFLSEEEDKKDSIIIIATLKSYASKVNFITKKFNVSVFAIPLLPDVKDPLDWINNKIDDSDNKTSEVLESIKKLRKEHFKDLVIIREELENLEKRLEVIHDMKNSDNFFVLSTWVPKSDIIKLKSELQERLNERIIIRTSFPEEEDTPPVKLTNPKWLKPFESLTELYALPNYRDLDPTFIVGPIFLIYAGFMLTDFVYGLMLLVGGFFVIRKFGKYNPGMKMLAINIFWIGFFAMLFGLLTGSYLGDAPKYFFGMTSEQLAIWKDPLTDPLYFLIISLSVAVVHLNVGLVLGLIEDIRKRAWKTAVSERGIWFLLQVSILLLYLKVGLIGKLLLGLTVLLVIIFHGPIGVLGITGFMGDAISYSRLFALALSTAGIALTVNLLADLLKGTPYIGFILAGIIFIAGHLFSLVMNALGSFVHSLRLQFVEFFSKFYEGGGDKFEPFREERFYTEVKGK